MAPRVKHSKVVDIPDDGTSPVGSDEWNADHTITGLENVPNVDTTNADNITSGVLAIAVGGTGTGPLVSNAFPGPGDTTQGVGIASGHIVPPLDMNVIYSGSGVYPFQIGATNPYCVGYQGTIASVSNGQIFSLRMASSHLTGSPITVSVTATGADTINSVTTSLRAAIQANPNLFNASTGLPLFCQGGAGSGLGVGIFNVQWDARYNDLTVTSIGTGSISLSAVNRNLDFAITVLGRRIPGYTGQSGDNVHVLQFIGQSDSGAMDAIVGQISASLPSAIAGNITGRLNFETQTSGAFKAQFGIQNGMVLYDSEGALPAGGFLGAGTLNLPASGSMTIGGTTIANSAVYSTNVFGGTAPGAPLNLQSTQSGAPSGDFVQIKAGGVVGYKFDGASGTLGGIRLIKGVYIIAASAVRSAITGTTAETTLATIAVPANSMGANGHLRVTVTWGKTGAANTWAVRTKFAGTAFGDLLGFAAANGSARTQIEISNRNATNSQVGASAGQGNWSQAAGAVVTAAIDTTSSQNITLTGQLTDAGDTIAVESYLVELIVP